MRKVISRLSAGFGGGQDGAILVTVMVLAVALTLVGFSLVGFGATHLRQTHENVFFANAIQVAEAGVEQSLHNLNLDDDFGGYPDDQVFFDNEVQGRGVFTTSVEDVSDSNAKVITSVGRVYRPNNLDQPVRTRTIRATAVGTGSEGFSVHAGVGGLLMSGSAKILNTDVFVNGRIQMTGAAQIGSDGQAADVHVANMSCPLGNNPGPTYPRVCGPGEGEPISLAWSTNINGTTCATGQHSRGPSGEGIRPSRNGGGLGLLLGCVAPPTPIPEYNRVNHISRMTTTGQGSSNTYVCNQWPFDREWPANLRLEGNVTVAGSCEVVINGDVYVTGNLRIEGNANVYVSDAVGTARPRIVVDGTITVGGSGALIANDQGTGMHFISYRTNASCNPNCTSLSGDQLRNSKDLLTVSVGGGVDLPGMIFQSYWGRLAITGSRSVGAAAGQTIDLVGTGTVTFGSILSSGSRTWTLSSYQHIFD